MAEDTIDAAVKAHDLQAGTCRTVGLVLQGAEGWSPTLYIRLVQDYGLESEVRLVSFVRFIKTNKTNRRQNR